MMCNIIFLPFSNQNLQFLAKNTSNQARGMKKKVYEAQMRSDPDILPETLGKRMHCLLYPNNCSNFGQKRRIWQELQYCHKEQKKRRRGARKRRSFTTAVREGARLGTQRRMLSSLHTWERSGHNSCRNDNPWLVNIKNVDGKLLRPSSTTNMNAEMNQIKSYDIFIFYYICTIKPPKLNGEKVSQRIICQSQKIKPVPNILYTGKKITSQQNRLLVWKSVLLGLTSQHREQLSSRPILSCGLLVWLELLFFEHLQ